MFIWKLSQKQGKRLAAETWQRFDWKRLFPYSFRRLAVVFWML
jgi:uncharacterized protein YbdZ (MbtH family)